MTSSLVLLPALGWAQPAVRNASGQALTLVPVQEASDVAIFTVTVGETAHRVDFTSQVRRPVPLAAGARAEFQFQARPRTAWTVKVRPGAGAGAARALPAFQVVDSFASFEVRALDAAGRSRSLGSLMFQHRCDDQGQVQTGLIQVAPDQAAGSGPCLEQAAGGEWVVRAGREAPRCACAIQ